MIRINQTRMKIKQPEGFTSPISLRWYARVFPGPALPHPGGNGSSVNILHHRFPKKSGARASRSPGSPRLRPAVGTGLPGNMDPQEFYAQLPDLLRNDRRINFLSPCPYNVMIIFRDDTVALLFQETFEYFPFPPGNMHDPLARVLAVAGPVLQPYIVILFYRIIAGIGNNLPGFEYTGSIALDFIFRSFWLWHGALILPFFNGSWQIPL